MLNKYDVRMRTAFNWLTTGLSNKIFKKKSNEHPPPLPKSIKAREVCDDPVTVSFSRKSMLHKTAIALPNPHIISPSTNTQNDRHLVKIRVYNRETSNTHHTVKVKLYLYWPRGAHEVQGKTTNKQTTYLVICLSTSIHLPMICSPRRLFG